MRSGRRLVVAQGPRDYIDPNKYFSNSLQFMENSLLIFLQSLFSTFPVGSYHYDNTPEASEVAIEGQNTDNLTNVDTRPKIVVARGPVRIDKAGINATIGSANLSLQQRRLATIRSGSVGISCYSRTDLEADRLAEICADSVESLVDVIRRFGFLEIRTAEIGQRAMIKADSRPELFVTPVLVRAQITKNYTREIMDPVKLRQIIFRYLINPVGLQIPPS
jgi:hypothetical protein